MLGLPLFLLSSLTSFAYCDSLTISAPITGPSSKPVPNSFVGLGIDGLSLPEYAGNDSQPNSFFGNLVSTIVNRSGSEVFLRIGGTKLDHTLYNASQTKAVQNVMSENLPSGANYTVGPLWFNALKLLQELPMNFIFQAPISVGTIQDTVTFARLGVEAINSTKLQAIEIGNEPDLSDFGSPQDYVNSWRQRAGNVSTNLTNLPNNIYQGLSLSSGASSPWNVSTIFHDGIDKNNSIKTVSHHFYEVYPGRGKSQPVANASQYLQTTLLNHTYTVSVMSGLDSAVTFLANEHPDIPLIIGEMGSGLAGGNNNATATKKILSSLGTAVWTLDFHLYCMSIGIAGISNQVGAPGWSFAPFAPGPVDDLPSGIRPTWYGIVAAADFLGHDVEKPKYVISLNASEDVIAYAAYQGDDLSSIALLNMKLWDPTINPGTLRPNTTVQLDVPSGVSSVLVKRLTGPGGLSLDNVTWGGESWGYHCGEGRPVQTGPVPETLQVESGAVNVTVGATEAVVVSMES